MSVLVWYKAILAIAGGKGIGLATLRAVGFDNVGLATLHSSSVSSQLNERQRSFQPRVRQ